MNDRKLPVKPPDEMREIINLFRPLRVWRADQPKPKKPETDWR